MSEDNDNGDDGDYGEGFENENENENNNENKEDPKDDENDQDDLLEEEPLEDNDKYVIIFINSQDQNKLNLTIGDTNGMDENE